MSKELSKSPTMREVPLNADEKEQEDDAIPEAQSLMPKASTLKRFFKFGAQTKRNPEQSDNQIETKSLVDIKAITKNDREEKPRARSQSRRFHLSLGGLHHRQPADISSSLSDRTASTSQGSSNISGSNPATKSLATLKGSISSYWNTLFRRHQTVTAVSSSSSNTMESAESTGSGSEKSKKDKKKNRTENASLDSSEVTEMQSTSKQLSKGTESSSGHSRETEDDIMNKLNDEMQTLSLSDDD